MASAGHSRLILLAISNSISLVTKHLTELEVVEATPQVIVFPSYQREEIVQILAQRLEPYDSIEDVDGRRLFDPDALDACARIISREGYGDARKALEICRLALNDATELPDQNIGGENDSQGTEEDDDSSRAVVSLAAVAKTLRKCLGSPHVHVIENLPQHQVFFLFFYLLFIVF